MDKKNTLYSIEAAKKHGLKITAQQAEILKNNLKDSKTSNYRLHV